MLGAQAGDRPRQPISGEEMSYLYSRTTRNQRPVKRMAALATALGVATLGVLAVPTVPAQATGPVTLDCSTTNLTLSEANAEYVLTGACKGVTVTNSNIEVKLASATSLTVAGANSQVAATGAIGRVRVTKANGRIVASKVGPVRLLAANQVLRAPRGAGVVLVKGANVNLRLGATTKLTIKGANNRAVLKRLPRLVVRGPNNVVKVQKGRTKASVRGANNVIRIRPVRR